MKKLTLTAIAFTIIFGVQLLIPNKSEAQISCNYDYWGNYVCTDSGGNRSSTTTDFWGNDVTTFNNGQKRMSCNYDYWGNYVCN